MGYQPKMISEPQKNFITKLVAERDLSGMPEEKRSFLLQLTDEVLDTFTSVQASNAIKALLACDKKPVEQLQADEPQLRDGYFFIVDPTNNEERFFRVQHGKPGGRWEGYQFLQVQASDYFYPIKDKAHRKAVLDEIAKDPVKAMNEYGLRIGRCGVCNRTLTDRHSILRGIGPICAGKLEPTGEQLAMIELIRNKSSKSEVPDSSET